MREYLATQGLQYEHDLPHPPIVYEGAFYDADKIQGIGIIRTGQVWLPDGNVLPIAQS